MIMKHYRVHASDIQFNLELKDNLILVGGESGTGKILLYKQIQDDAMSSPDKNIICLDYRSTSNGAVEDVLNTAIGKLIVIDNAEAVLSDLQRLKISLDHNNQYIIFTHSSKGFKPNKLSFTTLKIEGNKGYLKYDLL